MSDQPFSLSFEFFPPKTEEQQERFLQARDAFVKYSPEYYSVTFGAGGSTRDRTLETVLQINAETDIPPAPHISCIGTDKPTIMNLLNEYRQAGIDRLVVLRGDVPSGMASSGDFSYANELVAFIREEMGSAFHIDVGCYPECHPDCDSAGRDLENFRRKVEAGADGAITQYFFNPDAYFRFREAAEALGVSVPIIPGIMPISNYKQLARFSDSCGAEIPRWLRRRLLDFGDDLKSLRAFGLDVVTVLCTRLMEGGVPGLHIYSLNRAKTTCALVDNLGFEKYRPPDVASRRIGRSGS